MARKTETEAPGKPPSESEMRAALGEAYPAFRDMVARAGPGAAEWRKYTKSSPWVLKVSDGRRSLFYARPDEGHVRVTVLLGERAVEAALAGRVSKWLHEVIRGAKAYPEGRPVSVLLKRASDLASIEELLAVKRETAARPTRPRAAARPGRAGKR
jgi:hypothetical protein